MPMVRETHLAVVVSADDPEKRGRIRVTCEGLLGDDDAELPGWIEPSMDWGVFVLPNPKDQVEIDVLVSTDEDEAHLQSSIDQLDARWHGARLLGPDDKINPSLLESYGKRRGFYTPYGHLIMFDDTAGKGSVSVHFATAEGKSDPASRHSITVDKDGIKQTIADKHSFHFKVDGSVEVQIDKTAAMSVVGKGADTMAVFGDGAVHAAIYEKLQEFYTNSIKPYIENALVQTSMGPSSTILVAMGPAPDWDASIKGNHLAFPDG